MKLLAALVSITLLAAPEVAASSHLASSASAADLASESTYAANNPVRMTDRTGSIGTEAGADRLADSIRQWSPAARQTGAIIAGGIMVVATGGFLGALAAGAGGVGAVVMGSLPAEAVPVVTATAPVATMIVANADPGNVASVGPATAAKVATAAVDQAAPLVEKAAPRLTKEAERGIRSLEKRIAEHENKLEEFLKNPTIRPGMEKLSKEQITKAQQARAEHLRSEIDTFKENIEKLKGGKAP